MLIRSRRAPAISLAILLVLAGALATTVALWWHSDPAVHWEIVVDKLNRDFQRSDSGISHDRNWIPFSVLENPRRHYLDWKRSRVRIAIGFPNIDMGFHDYGTNHHAALSVHLFQNYARGISIWCDSPEESRRIDALIRQRFPRLPVRHLPAESVPIPSVPVNSVNQVPSVL